MFRHYTTVDMELKTITLLLLYGMWKWSPDFLSEQNLHTTAWFDISYSKFHRDIPTFISSGVFVSLKVQTVSLGKQFYLKYLSGAVPSLLEATPVHPDPN